MTKKLITAIIALCFLVESVGVNCLPSVAYANKDMLRPVAEANFRKIENATILPTTQQAISDIQDAIRKAWEAGIEYPTPVILFGSFADGYTTTESDLDISVPLLDIDPYEPLDNMRQRWLNFVRFLKTALKLKGYKFDERPEHGTEGVFQYDVGAMHILKTNGFLFKNQIFVISEDTVKSVNIGKRDTAPEANYLGTKSSSAGNKTAPISDVFIKLRHIYCEVRSLYHEQSTSINECIYIIEDIVESNRLAKKPILEQQYNNLHSHLLTLAKNLYSLDNKIRASLMISQEDLELKRLVKGVKHLYGQSELALSELSEAEETIVQDKDLRDLKEKTVKVRQKLEIFINLIKNLLDSIDAPISLKPANLNEIIKRAGGKYGIDKEAKEVVGWSVNLDLSADKRIENFPIYYENDWIKLFDNIFKNAVEHGLGYGIDREDETINVVSKIGEDNDILIEISDNGKGMPKEALEVVDAKTEKQRVFTEEYSEDKTEEQPWRGLGLALCWDIVTMHSGKIKVYSKFGKGTTFLIHLPSAEKSRKDKRLDESIASQFYKKKEDQLEVSFIPQPLFSLRGRLTIKNSKFAINRKLIEWNEDTRGVFYTNLWQILLYLAKEQGLVDFGDSIDNDFLLDLLLAPIGGRVATIDEILYNVFFSYLTDEEASGCRAEIRRSPRDFFRMFFGLLAKRKLDIEIILEYYPKREGYPDVIQLKIVNNKTLSDRDRARIREAFNIFRQIQELQGRIRLLENRDIWTERTGRGLVGFVNYINKGCSIYRFREYPKRTEQVVRLIGSLAFFKKDFIEKLRQASWRKKYQEDIPNPKDDSIDDSPKSSSAGNKNVPGERRTNAYRSLAEKRLWVEKAVELTREIIEDDRRKRKTPASKRQCEMHALLLNCILNSMGIKSQAIGLDYRWLNPHWMGLHYCVLIEDEILADAYPEGNRLFDEWFTGKGFVLFPGDQFYDEYAEGLRQAQIRICRAIPPERLLDYKNYSDQLNSLKEIYMSKIDALAQSFSKTSNINKTDLGGSLDIIKAISSAA